MDPLADVRVVQHEFRVLRAQVADAVASVMLRRQHNDFGYNGFNVMAVAVQKRLSMLPRRSWKYASGDLPSTASQWRCNVRALVVGVLAAS